MDTRRIPSPSPLRAWPGLWLLGLLPALVCVLALLPSPALAKGSPGYQSTPEWHRLVTLWHALLDHSSGVVYSPERFKGFANEVDRVEDGLHSLETRGLLPRNVAQGLGWVLRARYAYVRNRAYGTPRTGKQDQLESVEAASEWAVEMQLDLLRQHHRTRQADPKLESAIRTNLVTELTFQRSLRTVREDLVQREKALPEKEESQDGPAHTKFAQESARRRQSLLDAYERRNLPRDGVVQALMPYLFELTNTPPDRAGLG